jgi:carbamoyl-phosphate synthase large subunit
LQELFCWKKNISYKGKPLTRCPVDSSQKRRLCRPLSCKVLGLPEADIRNRRLALGITEGWETRGVSGIEELYYFSTYNAPDKTAASTRKKVMILGGGPPHRAGH